MTLVESLMHCMCAVAIEPSQEKAPDTDLRELREACIGRTVKRLRAIQEWLGFDQHELSKWQQLAKVGRGGLVRILLLFLLLLLLFLFFLFFLFFFFLLFLFFFFLLFLFLFLLFLLFLFLFFPPPGFFAPRPRPPPSPPSVSYSFAQPTYHHLCATASAGLYFMDAGFVTPSAWW